MFHDFQSHFPRFQPDTSLRVTRCVRASTYAEHEAAPEILSQPARNETGSMASGEVFHAMPDAEDQVPRGVESRLRSQDSKVSGQGLYILPSRMGTQLGGTYVLYITLYNLSILKHT